MRVRLYSLPKATSLTALQEARPSSIELLPLSLLNGVDDPASTLPEGTVVKRVEGGPPTAL